MGFQNPRTFSREIINVSQFSDWFFDKMRAWYNFLLFFSSKNIKTKPSLFSDTPRLLVIERLPSIVLPTVVLLGHGLCRLSRRGGLFPAQIWISPAPEVVKVDERFVLGLRRGLFRLRFLRFLVVVSPPRAPIVRLFAPGITERKGSWNEHTGQNISSRRDRSQRIVSLHKCTIICSERCTKAIKE